jgi:hypothetical protein
MRYRVTYGGTVIATGMAMGTASHVIGWRSPAQSYETHAVPELHYHELKEQPMPVHEAAPIVAGAGLGMLAWKLGELGQRAYERFTVRLR